MILRMESCQENKKESLKELEEIKVMIRVEVLRI